MSLLQLPRLCLNKSHRFLRGCPWVYSNEVDPLRDLAAGSLVALSSKRGDLHAVGAYHPNSLVAFRELIRSLPAPLHRAQGESVSVAQELLQDVVRVRLAAAFSQRVALLGQTASWRWVHSEGDRLPGLVLDRFHGDGSTSVVVQLNSAMWERNDFLHRTLVDTVQELDSPRSLIYRNDTYARELEGLPSTSAVVGETYRSPTLLRDVDIGLASGPTFFADLLDGQKTGWFFDQRSNRALLAALVRQLHADGREVRVLDCFSYSGGFGITAAFHGASEVACVDESKPALDLAMKAGLAIDPAACHIRYIWTDVFSYLRDSTPNALYDVVVLDPPRFARSRQEVPQALRAYSKLVALASRFLVQKQPAFLMIMSCSHNVSAEALGAAVADGAKKAGRAARLLRMLHAGVDHPVHPFLADSQYLSGWLVSLDAV